MRRLVNQLSLVLLLILAAVVAARSLLEFGSERREPEVDAPAPRESVQTEISTRIDAGEWEELGFGLTIADP